jgi:glycosyltransferase involved in cell wall biosynthesis
MKKITISVINDLVTDQRVLRMAGTLAGEGYYIFLIGRKPDIGSPEPETNLTYHRFRLLFNRGPLFYAVYNIRLFWFLLFTRRPDLLMAVDLDTLPANYLVSRIRRIPLLYDSHEYFTEVPELIDRPFVRNVWERIERRIVPKLKTAIAVSESISRVYTEKYGTEFITIRNFPLRSAPQQFPGFNESYTAKYKIIYQGALNTGRGLELMIEAMNYIDDTILFIVGEGDIMGELQRKVHSMNLPERIFIPGRIMPTKLKKLTAQCNLGISLEEDIGLNYRLALPNKIFDYIQAEIPVLCSDLPEMAALVRKYKIGEVCISREAEKLAGQITGMMKDTERKESWKRNLKKAAAELCWENEEEKLIAIVTRIVGDIH